MEGKPEEEKRNLLHKLKDGIEDNETQIQVLSTFVRLGVVVWAGFIITCQYIYRRISQFWLEYIK